MLSQSVVLDEEAEEEEEDEDDEGDDNEIDDEAEIGMELEGTVTFFGGKEGEKWHGCRLWTALPKPAMTQPHRVGR